MSGLYIHIPFCKKKCLYCDFYSAGIRIADWHLYLSSVLNELTQRKREISLPLQTLYLGGGTPSLIPPETLFDFLVVVKKIVKQKEFIEITLEANPDDINPQNISIWKEAGINRVSLGVQSLNDGELELIGRRHDSLGAKEAITLLTRNFDNVSVDIISGLPGQSFASYKESLNELISFKPQHVSVYSLMLEPGTPMTNLYKSGKICLPEEEEWLKMQYYTIQRLNTEGYDRYEISNFSLPGFESRHNNLYWKGNPYLGLGPGAHSFDGRKTRRFNPSDLKRYMKFYQNPTESENFYKTEFLSETESREEFVMTSLRLTKGLNYEEFKIRFGVLEYEHLKEKALKYIRNGLMSEENNYLKFSDNGFNLSDSIMAELI